MAATVDNKTPRLGLPLPDRQNFLQDDVERLITTIKDLDGEVALIAADGKLEPSQLPDNAAKLDAKGVLLDSQLSAKVVTVDDQGKVPMGQIPSAALTNYYEASNTAQMLALTALPGDVCKRLDNQMVYMLASAPATVAANWRELPPTAVHSVNGKSGAVTGIAEVDANGDNSSIKTLSGLTAPFVLPGDGVNSYDAVTVRQLQSVTAGQGATMNGVMNNFIGAVEWFNGSRSALPAGYIAADGQLESRTDPNTADLWAAVDKGFLMTVAEATWVGSKGHRAKYTKGDGTKNFRVPDLNGVLKQGVNGFTGVDSINALFLRGDGLIGAGVGSIGASKAPNITGGFVTKVPDGHTGYRAGAFVGSDGPQISGTTAPAKYTAIAGNGDNIDNARFGYAFNASLSSPVYVDGAQEVSPNFAAGIWIIRANGAFQAANTAFEVINQDATTPANGTTVKGGMLQSSYKLKGDTVNAAGLLVSNTIGGNPSATVGVANYNSQTKSLNWKSWYFEWDGGIRFPTSGFIRTAGGYFTIDAATRCLDLHTNAGGGCGVVQGGEPNRIELNNQRDQFIQGDWVNWLLMDWYGGYGKFGLVRGGSKDIEGLQVTIVQDPSMNARTMDWRFKANGEFNGPLGIIGPAVSDATLKHAIGRSKPGALERINRINTHEFTWNHTDRRERGWLAQELRDIDPLYVIECDNGVLNTPYNCIIADLIDAVKTLTQRNAELEARLAKLEA
ncbi:tail fiber domain-containing protein [Salmonella enterica]